MKQFIAVSTLLWTGSLAVAGSPLVRSVEVGCREVLANSFSQTLYVFDPDLGAEKPKCNGTCAEIWPPYLISPVEASQLSAPLSYVARESGRIQLTYQGRPVYLFHLDRTPGDLKGDGLGNV